MTTRTTNTILIKTLIQSLGERRPEAYLEYKADVSRTSIKDMLRGAVPGVRTRKKIADFFGKNEDELFPLIDSMQGAA
jgi:hypothetical protein